MLLLSNYMHILWGPQDRHGSSWREQEDALMSVNSTCSVCTATALQQSTWNKEVNHANHKHTQRSVSKRHDQLQCHLRKLTCRSIECSKLISQHKLNSRSDKCFNPTHAWHDRLECLNGKLLPSDIQMPHTKGCRSAIIHSAKIQSKVSVCNSKQQVCRFTGTIEQISNSQSPTTRSGPRLQVSWITFLFTFVCGQPECRWIYNFYLHATLEAINPKRKRGLAALLPFFFTNL